MFEGSGGWDVRREGEVEIGAQAVDVEAARLAGRRGAEDADDREVGGCWGGRVQETRGLEGERGGIGGERVQVVVY